MSARWSTFWRKIKYGFEVILFDPEGIEKSRLSVAHPASIAGTLTLFRRRKALPPNMVVESKGEIPRV